MSLPRRSNVSRQSRNETRIRNITNEKNEEEQEIAREERRRALEREREYDHQELVVQRNVGTPVKSPTNVSLWYINEDNWNMVMVDYISWMPLLEQLLLLDTSLEGCRTAHSALKLPFNLQAIKPICTALTMFRSEEMVLCQLFVQPEAAYVSMYELGEAGIAQFRDVSL
ncbi:unnamed protein product [Pieris macdunnoughi]|uniref:Uncharacterized protein n=1 Tax=Pieris macdunnoughi TaxID=345717 RepID=A0A821MCY7_9NEOP|nr:unnamed protein product [Pieris macdunnoughi]